MTRPDDCLATHEVTNQPAREVPHDPAGSAPPLAAHAATLGANTLHLARFGAALSKAWDLAAEARRVPPETVIFDRHGRRLDEVRFHPPITTSCRSASAMATPPFPGRARQAATSPMPPWST